MNVEVNTIISPCYLFHFWNNLFMHIASSTVSVFKVPFCIIIINNIAVQSAGEFKWFCCLCWECNVECTHRRQGKERDPQQSKPCWQEPTWPSLWCLIPIANGSKSDLRKQTSVIKGQRFGMPGPCRQELNYLDKYKLKTNSNVQTATSISLKRRGKSQTHYGFAYTMESWFQWGAQSPTVFVLIIFLCEATTQCSKSHMLDAKLHLQQLLSNLRIKRPWISKGKHRSTLELQPHCHLCYPSLFESNKSVAYFKKKRKRNISLTAPSPFCTSKWGIRILAGRGYLNKAQAKANSIHPVKVSDLSNAECAVDIK